MPIPDGGCPALTHAYVATLVTVPVTWPAVTTSGLKISKAGSGNVQIVLLADETFATDGGTESFTGTSRTCATTLPPVAFDTDGATLSMIPSGDTGYLMISLPDSLWDKITRTTPITGTTSGSTTSTNPSVGLFGLSATSSFANPATAWPAACSTGCTPTGAFAAGDVSPNNGDDDGDTNPGITALGVKMLTGKDDYIYPPSAAIGGTPADQIYTVSRTALSVTSTQLDCSTGSGTAKVTLFDNHVVGCHLTTGSACNSTQVSFLDSNRVVYVLGGGATVKTKIITKASPSCVDARAAVGFTG